MVMLQFCFVRILWDRIYLEEWLEEIVKFWIFWLVFGYGIVSWTNSGLNYETRLIKERIVQLGCIL